MGQSAEQSFEALGPKQGWEVRPAPLRSNVDEHWDFLIEKGGRRYRVEVKAMKRLERSDPDVQDRWVWIELHGVRPHDRGWLYGGKAHLIAFETRNSFVVVPRKSLCALVRRVVNFKAIAPSAGQAKYAVYSRPGRYDALTLIEMKLLLPIAWAEWPKAQFL